MRWRRNNVDPEQNQVNMTPLIDVSLVLVVMLLLATPLAFETAIAVKKTDTSGKRAETETKVENVEIEIISDDVTRVNRAEVPRYRLHQALRPLLAADTPRRVIITCRDEVSHGAFVNVLDVSKLSGAAEIAVMGE